MKRTDGEGAHDGGAGGKGQRLLARDLMLSGVLLQERVHRHILLARTTLSARHGAGTWRNSRNKAWGVNGQQAARISVRSHAARVSRR